jgi:Tautomerase enzyme
MLIQIMLRADTPSQVSQMISGVVRDAAHQSLRATPRIAFVQTSIADTYESANIQQDQQRDARVAILIYASERYDDREKRRLFGHISDCLEQRLAIARQEILTCVVEVPASNWSCGYDERVWISLLSYQLP